MGGRLTSRDVDVGAVVRKGQKLAQLSAVDYQNKVTAAEADLAAAKAAVAQAAPQEQRYRALLERQITTRPMYENALKALQSAEAQVQAAEANLRIAKNQLSYTELLAPDDGVVTATAADPGQVVAAGQKVVEISRSSERDAVFAVAGEHIAHATLGMPVKAWLQGRPDIAVIGSLRQISPEADSTTGTYEVKVALPSPPPEMRLGAVVVGRAETEGPEVMSVPSNALLQSGDGPQVWVVAEDGTVHRRAVELTRVQRGFRRRQARPVGRRESRDRRRQLAGRRSAGEARDGGQVRYLAGRRPAGEGRDGGQVMTRFNLSEWAVNNKAIVVFLMLLCAIGGFSAYERLGRQEDPDFSVQTMVVQVAWPGATALDTLKQVTDRLEKKLEETPHLDYLKSYTKPGQSTVFVYLKESTPKRDLPDIWYQVRKKVSDIQATLPKGIVGPFFNDEFGDVFGIIYGITYDGFTPREARDFAETARAEFLRSPDVGKVEIFGDQDEKSISTSRRRSSRTSSSTSMTCSRRSPSRTPSCPPASSTRRARTCSSTSPAPSDSAEHRQPQPLGERRLLQTDRHRRGPSRLQRSAHQDVPRQRQARHRHRRQHGLGRQQSHLR